MDQTVIESQHVSEGSLLIADKESLVLRFQDFVGDWDEAFSQEKAFVINLTESNRYFAQIDSSGFSAKQVRQAIGNVQFDYFDISVSDDIASQKDCVLVFGLPDRGFPVSAVPLLETAHKLIDRDFFDFSLCIEDETDARDIHTVWENLYPAIDFELFKLKRSWLIFCQVRRSGGCNDEVGCEGW